MEKYFEELLNFISKKSKFINDNNFEQIKLKANTKDTSIISIIENFIENEFIFPSEKTCLIIYLKELTENKSLREELLDNINKKFIKNSIKSKEIKDINFLLVYYLSEENWINENYENLKEYFEDYLSQLQEAEEYEEIKKNILKEIALEEKEEQERRLKLILPKINKCEIVDITENEIIINVPLFEENEILSKNIYKIKNSLKNYINIKIEYVIYLYNEENKCYDEYVYPKLKENIKEKKGKYQIKISHLKPDKLYMFLIGIKFNKNYSNPTFNKFNFMTMPTKKSGKLIIYGDKKYTNNLIEEKSRIILPNNISSYNSCFNKGKTLFPLIYKTIIKDISISDNRLCFIKKDNNFSVYEAGSIISFQPEDIFEGSFPKEKEIISLSDKNYFLEYFDSNLFEIKFNNNIKIKKVRVGANHCLALSTLGECYSWGENKFGQLGLGIANDDIVGNPHKIKFDIFDNNGNKIITNLNPFFYDIATGNYFSLALGLFNNKQILYYWGNGAGMVNDDKTKVIQANYPKEIKNLENIISINARFNSIGILCFDKEKKINILYIHGTQKFGIDFGLELHNRANPVIVNYFKDNNFNVLKVNFSITCMSVVGKNMNNGKIEVYLRGELVKKLFEFKDYKSSFYKIENSWSEDILAVSPQEKVIFFLLKNGVVKKLYTEENNLKEKEIKIEGYDLNNLEINDIKETEFHSFHNENFVIFYKLKEELKQKN